eukprot:827999-Amphidinium_carterae.1
MITCNKVWFQSKTNNYDTSKAQCDHFDLCTRAAKRRSEGIRVGSGGADPEWQHVVGKQACKAEAVDRELNNDEEEFFSAESDVENLYSEQ